MQATAKSEADKNECINLESHDLFSSDEEDELSEAFIPETQQHDQSEGEENECVIQESPDFFDTEGSDDTDNSSNSDCRYIEHEQVDRTSDSDQTYCSQLECPDSDDSQSQLLLSRIRKKINK